MSATVKVNKKIDPRTAKELKKSLRKFREQRKQTRLVNV